MRARALRLLLSCAVGSSVLAACGSCGGASREGGGGATAPVRGTRPARVSTRGDLPLRVPEVSSSRVRLEWDAVEGAAAYEILLGAEPSTRADGALEVSRSVARLGPQATSHEVSPLAAATDAFLRVEARDAAGTVLAWGNTHARLRGGPRAALDLPLRSVHAYGPRTLLLVLQNTGVVHRDGALEGDVGARWQASRFEITRASGAALGVRAVHRQTLPVAQPGYEVGYERWGDGNQLTLDHHLFLELEAPLGSADVLEIEAAGEQPLRVLVPFSDRYLETPLLQVNQVGYNPRATTRYAYASGWMGDGGSVSFAGAATSAEVLGEPLDALTARAVVVDGLAVRLRAARDEESGGEVREIDLSSVPAAEGVRYRVRLPGVGVSFPTAVSEEAALRAYFTVARGLYLNRFCGDLAAEHTEWARPRDHCEAFFVTGRHHRGGLFPADTPQRDARPVRGGHHDAGDFDIRAFHVVVGQYLLRAFELHPERFPDGQLSLPESGNGVPDLLDEALYSLAAWEALQDADGRVRAGIESHREPAGIYPAHEDRLPYFTFAPEPWHTVYVAALFAQSARLVAPYDAPASQRLRRAAVSAYDAPGSAGAPPAYRLYAAGELARLTGEARYAQEFARRWRELDRYGRGAFDHVQPMAKIYDGAFEDYAPAMADFVMGYLRWEGADPEIVRVAGAQLREHADRMAAAILESPHAHRNGRPPSEPRTWGQSTTTGRHADMMLQAMQLPDLEPARRQRYLDAMSVAADYALGANPASYAWITGLGSRRPMEPLHLDSLVSIARGEPPVPGLPVFGPVEELPGAGYYGPVRASFHPPFGQIPGGRRVSDTHASVVTNEFSVWTQQAPMALLFAALVGEGQMPPSSWRAGGALHRATLATLARDPEPSPGGAERPEGEPPQGPPSPTGAAASEAPARAAAARPPAPPAQGAVTR